MARHRYGVALLFDPEVSLEIRGLRRAFGAHLRMEPHITLVPPINLHDHQLDEAMVTLRSVTSRLSSPLQFTIGPANTFAPITPVVYLAVNANEGHLAAIHELHADLHDRTPFQRPPKFAYVPHVSLHEDCPPDRIQLGVSAFDAFSIEATVDRLWLLRDNPDRRVWEAVSDVCFDPPTKRGHGGLELLFRVSSRPAAGRFPPELAARSKLAIEATDSGNVIGVLMDDGESTYLWIAEGYERFGIEDRLYTERSR